MTELNEWIEKSLLTLNLTDSMETKDGFTRLGFSKEEKLAHEQFQKIASSLGLKTWQDQVGNQWAVWEVDPDAPTIGIGSHLDTVFEGGGYDGVVGIVAALGAIRELKKKNIKPNKNIAVISFVCEESSRFGVSTIGSKTIVGDIEKNKWEKITDQENITMVEAMEEFGVDWDEFHEAYCEDNQFESFLELHIEQGSHLFKENIDIGIVYGISTPIRLKITALGKANHTGTTQMHERKDALVAIAPLINYVQKKALELNKQSEHPLVATVSTVNVTPNAMNVIPGKVELGIDIRSVDDNLKDKFSNLVKSYCKRLEAEHQIKIEVEEIVNEEAVILNEEIQQKLAETCESLEISFCKMNSGAGHDVMNIAKRWPSGLIFIPSVNGISHHPDEYTPLRNIRIGISLLTEYLRREAG